MLERAWRAIVSGDGELDHVLWLASTDPPRAPRVVVRAIEGLHRCGGEFDNGGADQFVWNHGAAQARDIGAAWCEVGAVENGELLGELAAALERYLVEGVPDDPVQAFMGFRRSVGGPCFGRPALDEELAEALVEWATEHPDGFGASLAVDVGSTDG